MSSPKFKYIDEKQDFSLMDPEAQKVYAKELFRMYTTTLDDVHRLRQNAGMIVLRDPTLQATTSTLPAPHQVRSKPIFQSQLKGRLSTSCKFEQPFSKLQSVLTINQTGMTLLWDAQRMKRYEYFNVTRGGIMCCAVNKSGSVLLTGGLSCHVEAFSLGHELNQRLYQQEVKQANLPLYNTKPTEKSETGRPANFRCIFSGHNDAVSSVVFNEDAKCISFGHDGLVLSHDVITGDCSSSIDYQSSINTADGNPTTSYEYIVGLRNGRMYLGDQRVDRVGLEIANGLGSLEKVKVLNDGHTLAASFKGQVELFDLRSFGSYDSYTSEWGNISTFDLSNSGRVMVCGTDSGQVTTVDLVQHQWAPKPFAKKGDRIAGVHICDDKIYVGSWDGTLSTYKIKN